jgi:hypothetical protein
LPADSAFLPTLHQRAVRSTRRDLVDRGPAHGQGTRLRAQFASSLRRLELNLVQMWQKATDRAADRQNAEVARLQVSSTKRTH